MKRTLVLNQRQLKETKLNLYYAKFLEHGTDGHNLRILQAQLATALGFALNEQGDLTYNDNPLPFSDGVQLTISWDSETVNASS